MVYVFFHSMLHYINLSLHEIALLVNDHINSVLLLSDNGPLSNDVFPCSIDEGGPSLGWMN